MKYIIYFISSRSIQHTRENKVTSYFSFMKNCLDKGKYILYSYIRFNPIPVITRYKYKKKKTQDTLKKK
ncbi:hypothetical protein PFBG_05316 [Plasmodium falciparum 7G8]|uniref:Uncharacterized protein n=1 Tax=Plasmodium falciparum (isolate 7G8) TaxID=57266 RepID=W7F7U5_PLAF8|nr:hypothetical protein PFBG_05316 [Plasmodium falciparum 7G8]